MSGNARSGTLSVNAWNIENKEGGNSFDCEENAELYRYFLQQEPVPVLLLIDRQAKWNQELENVYLISCEIISDGDRCIQQHYEYELRPCPS